MLEGGPCFQTAFLFGASSFGLGLASTSIYEWSLSTPRALKRIRPQLLVDISATRRTSEPRAGGPGGEPAALADPEGLAAAAAVAEPRRHGSAEFLQACLLVIPQLHPFSPVGGPTWPQVGVVAGIGGATTSARIAGKPRVCAPAAWGLAAAWPLLAINVDVPRVCAAAAGVGGAISSSSLRGGVAVAIYVG